VLALFSLAPLGGALIIIRVWRGRPEPLRPLLIGRQWALLLPAALHSYGPR
jgi:hypothetical protein